MSKTFGKLAHTVKPDSAKSGWVLQFSKKPNNIWAMSSKELVLELVRKLPDEASMLDIAREIEFVAGVREAMSEFDHGDSVETEQLLKEIPQWAGTTK